MAWTEVPLAAPIRRFFAKRAFNGRRLIVYEGMAGVLKAGAASKTPTWAAQFETWRNRAQSRNQLVAIAYEDIRRRLENGHSLSKALAPFIPPEEAMVIDAGEASGKLIPTLDALARSAEAAREIRDAIKGAYRAPTGALLGFIAVSVISGATIWPSMLEALPPKYWDGWALAIMYFQIYLTEHLALLTLVLLIYAAYRYSLPNWIGARRRWAEKVLPMYATYRDRNASSLLIVMASLLRAGKTMDQALERISAQGTPYLRWHTRAMQRRLVAFAGDPARILSSGLFSDDILDRITNATASRQLADAIQHIGTEAIMDVVKSVKTAAIVGATLMYVMVGALFAYYTAVQVLGAQSASDRYMREIKFGEPASK
jgi:type II secretory pathway component PulF